MLELTSSGSKAIHYRAVELAGVYDMPILVAASYQDSPGTLIHGGLTMEVRNKVRGIAHDLDVAVRFGFRIIKGDALRIARYGVWSYHHGDNLVNRGGPAGFWEVMEDADVTGSVLQRLTEELDNGQVLYRSFSPTNRFSVAKNQTDLFWSSTAVLPRVLEDLHRHGPTVIEECDGRSAWHGYSNRLYVVPGNREMAGHMVRLGRRYLVERLRNTLAFDQWFVSDVWNWLRDDAKTWEVEDVPWREAVDAGCTAAVMEVSSHALELRRVAALEFDVAPAFVTAWLTPEMIEISDGGSAQRSEIVPSR